MRFAVVVLVVLLAGVTPNPDEPGTGAATGWATWYDDPNRDGLYAAAGPALRQGKWRGDRVTVSSGGRSVTLRLVDWCACGDRHGIQTVIDLSSSAFRRLAPLGRGVIRVSVRVDGDGPRATLPATDTEDGYKP